MIVIPSSAPAVVYSGGHPRLRRLLALVAGVLALGGAAVPAFAVSGDELWDTHWNRPGTDGEVDAVVEWNGQLVIGGDFQFVGDVAANRVAVYDGSAWAPLGIGFDEQVLCLCVHNNELYAGGYFNLSDGTPVGGLARWSGTQWVSVDGGTDDTVEDMVVHNGQLVIAGYFSEVGSGIPAGSIAGWTGSTWATFNGGIAGAGAYAVASYGSDLYVTGEFEEIGSIYVANIARWNGTSWSGSFGGLTDEFGDQFNASGENLFVYDNQLIVTGYFAEAGGQSLENFAAYNGSGWGTIGPDPSYFSSGAFTIGEYGGELLVYGGGTATHSWNGSFWSADIYGGAVFAMGQWSGNLVLGGILSQTNFTAAANLIAFDGFTWFALADGDGGSGSVLAFQEWNGQLAVGGSGTRFRTVSGGLVAAWDGTNWTSVGNVSATGGFGGRKVECLASYQGDLIAGGDFLMADGNSVNFVARYDGTSWQPMGLGSTSTVHALTVFNNDLYGGIYQSGYGVRRWDGSAWQLVGGTTNSFITCLGEYAGQLVVGGNFISIGGSAITGLATWDGTSWNPIGGSVAGTVYGLAVKDGKLYIAGQFASVNGVSANRVAVWDGSTWAAVGSGVNARVFDMTLFGGDIIVTGEFTADGGGSPLNRIARWDGTAWQPMGSGIDDDGQALGSFGAKLFVGGDFDHAGGTSAVGLSSWGMAQTAAWGPLPVNERIGLQAFPNPLRTRTAVAFDLRAPGDVTLTVFDLRGRQVSLEVFPGLAAGQHELPWNGHDEGGRPVAAGVYFLEAQSGRDVARGRVTVVR